jgi:hypothetical protein
MSGSKSTKPSCHWNVRQRVVAARASCWHGGYERRRMILMEVPGEHRVKAPRAWRARSYHAVAAGHPKWEEPAPPFAWTQSLRMRSAHT